MMDGRATKLEQQVPQEYKMVKLMALPWQVERVLREDETNFPQSVVSWGTTNKLE